MSRFIGFLIIIGGLVGTYFVYQDFAASRKEKHNRFADEIRGLIQDHGVESKLASKDLPGSGNNGSFYQILGLMHEAERHQYSVADTAKNAVTGSNMRPGEAKMVMETLLENYRIARQLGVFEDLSNALRMERGEAPVSKAKGWEDEPLTVGHVLSPVVAPEAALSLANLVLMPKRMRDMQNEDLTGFSPEMSKKWLSERIITPESHQAILEILSTKKF